MFEARPLIQRAHAILPEVEAARAILPDLDTLDHEAMKALVREQHAQLLSHEAEIEHLKLLLAKLQRQQFGRKSERVERQIEQLSQISGGYRVERQ